MSEFLENLKARHAESQKRYVAKQAQVAALNAEFQAIAQEFNAWQTLLNLETRKEQSAAAHTVATVNAQVSIGAHLVGASTSAPDVNKTEIVRDLLRQHSAGMSPGELWRQDLIRAQFQHRAYLYSVLKRLKDRGDITVKRGKYCFKYSSKPEEIQATTNT